jgi:DNA-binding PadR family transcriptional regulator
MTDTRPHSATSLLPLKTTWFHVLVSLADGERHGYGIMQEVLQRTEGDVRLWPATLYGSLRQLLEEGLIAECHSANRAENDDSRRRYYRLSTFGRRVLAAEIARLDGLLKAARAKGLTPAAELSR